jgi:GDPmannose 4,6-dehydratase
MKIINTAIEIHKNHTGKLLLGSLEYKRDWSYAEDIVNAIYLINQNPKSKTYVIGSGKSHSIKQLVELVFQEFNLNYKNYIEIDENLLRKDDSHEICSNPLKLEEDYGWKPKYHFEDFVKKILNYKVKNL